MNTSPSDAPRSFLSRWGEECWQDMRYAFRQMRKAPGFTLICVLTITLGIGATTTIFSVVDNVLFRALPFPDSDRLVVLREITPNARWGMISRAAFTHWREHATSFTSLSAYHWGNALVGESGAVVGMGTWRITRDYLPTLEIEPFIGRNFSPEEMVAGRDHVVILSHAFWRQYFAGQFDVVGRTLRMDQALYTVVGVLPPNPQFDATPLYLPLTDTGSDGTNFRGDGMVTGVVARLKPGVTLPQARKEMETLAASFAQEFPKERKNFSARVAPMLDDVVDSSFYVKDVKPLLWSLLGAVAFLLAIACANVANLLLTRGIARQKEIALRAALGAGRLRIVRQLACENFLLALMGGGLGLLLSLWGIHLVAPLAQNLPRSGSIALDRPVLAFALAATVMTSFAFGLWPAWQASRGTLRDCFQAGGQSTESRGSRRIRGGLVVVQLALALMLLTGAGLLIKNFTRLQRVDVGFSTEHRYVEFFPMRSERYRDPAKQVLLVDQLVANLEAEPGIQRAAIATSLPLYGSSNGVFSIRGKMILATAEQPSGSAAGVTTKFFDAMGIRLLKGRTFTAQDDMSAPAVVVISAELARRYFAGIDPIGQQVTMPGGGKGGRWCEIVGVVSDVRGNGPTSPLDASIYAPYSQAASGFAMLLVQAEANRSGLNAMVKKVMRSLDPELPFASLYPASHGLQSSVAKYRLSMIIFTGFGACALLLGAIGIAGTLAYNASQRTAEFGIRLALGAQPRDIRDLVLGQAARLVGAGISMGLLGAWMGERYLQSLLVDMNSFDRSAWLGGVAVLGGVALLASWWPVRKAAKVDPLVALRHD